MRTLHISFPFAACAVTSLILLLGCPSTGGDDDDDDATNPPGGCGFPEGGADGAAAISVGTPVLHHSVDTAAQNTIDLEFSGQLPAGGSTAMRIGPCGAAGMLLRIEDTTLSIVDPRVTTGPETIEQADGQYGAALFYDADCAPLVIAATPTPTLVEYVRDATWTATSVLDDPAALLGTEVSSLNVLDAEEGADGKLYVFVQAYGGGSPSLIRGVRDATAGASWSFEPMTGPEATELYDWAVGPAGETAAVFKNTQYPCDPCDVDFYLGTLSSPGGTWSTEVVQPGKWGDPHDEFVESASVAFGADGSPYVAAHFVERVITGSYVACELRIYGEVDGAWCGETIASANDAYAGEDGTTFTGADPVLLIDSAGRMHVAFRDQAIWHDGDNYQNEIRGQLRYAVRSGSTWTTETLASQPGQTESSNPLIGVSPPLLAVAPDGGQVVVAGVAHVWETDSIYNTNAAPVVLAATAVGAELTYP